MGLWIPGSRAEAREPGMTSMEFAERSLSLDAHRDAHASPDAEGGEAFLGVALLHLVEQRHKDAGAGGADRMAEGDRAAVDVDLVGIPAEVLVDGAGLRRERLVRLDQVEVADVP